MRCNTLVEIVMNLISTRIDQLNINEVQDRATLLLKGKRWHTPEIRHLDSAFSAFGMKASTMKIMDFFVLVFGRWPAENPPNSRQFDARQKLRADVLFHITIEAAAGHATLKTWKGFRIGAMAGLPHYCPTPATCAAISSSPEAETGLPQPGLPRRLAF